MRRSNNVWRLKSTSCVHSLATLKQHAGVSLGVLALFDSPYHPPCTGITECSASHEILHFEQSAPHRTVFWKDDGTTSYCSRRHQLGVPSLWCDTKAGVADSQRRLSSDGLARTSDSRQGAAHDRDALAARGFLVWASGSPSWGRTESSELGWDYPSPKSVNTRSL